MTHYICTGDCKGVSDTPGTCQAATCPKFAEPLTPCDCTDNSHNASVNGAGVRGKENTFFSMKTKLFGAGVLAIILLGAGYAYFRNTEQQSVSGESVSTFTCGDFTFTYPLSWHAWRESEIAEVYSDSCTVATFPQDALEEKAVGIGYLTNNENDAFVGLYVRSDMMQSLDEYIESIYCRQGEHCMEPYIESKTSMSFSNGTAFKVVDSGAEYPPAITYYFKKGTEIMAVASDKSNKKREAEILSIIESVE